MLPLVYHPDYSYAFPEDHRFSMDKFLRLHQILRDKGIANEGNVFRPSKMTRSELSKVHDLAYIDAFMDGTMSKQSLRKMGLPHSQELVHRSMISPAGTRLTGQLALEHGVACHLAGGTHHAQVDEPSGFCIFNDLALATVHLLDDQANHLKRILIFDVDVHQGDGTARLLEDVDGAFTCSIHCQKNFPFRKAQSDVDVGCEVGMRDEAYLKMVEATLLDCMDRFRPNLMFYDAGVDVYGKDKLGKLMISLKGIRLRDRLVLDVCKSRQIPVATVIGGGYDENGDALARRHAICIEEAHRLWC